MRSNSEKGDLLICVALARFSYEFDESHPELSATAWQLAIEHATRQGVRPVDATNILGLSSAW